MENKDLGEVSVFDGGAQNPSAPSVEGLSWQPIETAPKDGSLFLCLIDGLPYAARYDEYGRFIWYWHSDAATGPAYLIHDIDGKRLLEETKPREPAEYVARGHLWVNGFNDKNRTRWMPLPASSPIVG